MIKRFLIGIFFFIPTFSVIAQSVSLESVLATSLSDEKVIRDNEMEKFSRTLNYRLPPVKKLEFRLGFNGNNTPDSLDGSLRNEDYYSISLTTNKWKEMKLQKQIKPVQTNLFSKELEMYRMQAMQERFSVVANLYYSLETIKKKRELLDLLNKKNELLQQLLNEGVAIKINDALDTEKDLILITGLIQDEDNSISIDRARIKQFFNTYEDIDVNFDGIISINKILAINSILRQDSSATNPLVVYKEAQYQFAKANYKLEKVQNMNILNSFQIGYNHPAYAPEVLKKFNPDNTLTFRFGISVPIPGNYNLNKNTANLQQRDALLNWESAQRLQNKAISQQEIRLSNSIKQYNALLDIYTKSVVNKLLNNDKILAQSTALEIMDMKIARKKIEINISLNAGNLMQNYIELLGNKGLLLYELRHKYLMEN